MMQLLSAVAFSFQLFCTFFCFFAQVIEFTQLHIIPPTHPPPTPPSALIWHLSFYRGREDEAVTHKDINFGKPFKKNVAEQSNRYLYYNMDL